MIYPTEYHVLNLAGQFFSIDGEVRKEIEAFLRATPARTDFIIITTIIGDEVTVIADAVNLIYSITPEARARDAEWRRQEAAEEWTP